MSEILSYSNNTSKNGEEDWIAHAPYSDDDIARIKDPDGGLSENPRTAIPSPLAQLDLVKNAFKQLANERLRGARMNERLVSNALDVAQLFFDYENHKDYRRQHPLEVEAQHRIYRNPETVPGVRFCQEVLLLPAELVITEQRKQRHDTIAQSYTLHHRPDAQMTEAQ